MDDFLNIFVIDWDYITYDMDIIDKLCEWGLLMAKVNYDAYFWLLKWE